MAVTVRGRTEFVGSNTSQTLAEPPGTQNGDVLFTFAVTTAAGLMTLPVGWTRLYGGVASASSWVVGRVQRGETAPNMTWTWTGNIAAEVYVVGLQKNGEGPLRLHAQSIDGAITASSAVAPNPGSVTMTVPTGLALCVGQNFNGAVTTGWACAGYTAQTSNAVGQDGCLFSKSLSVAGIEDPPLWTTGVLSNNDLWDGATLVFTDVPFLTAGYGSSPATIKKRVPRSQLLGD